MSRRILLTMALISTAMPVAVAQRGTCRGSEPTAVQLQSRAFPVQKIGNAVLFRAGMEVDADGAPNAYGPDNTGLDLTANAKNGSDFVGVVSRPDGKPVVQEKGRFKGFYVSATSLQAAGGNKSAPGTYVGATKIRYIALPPEFAEQFGLVLGDLAVVTNWKSGKSAFAIYADVGPHGKIGEGSVALAKALGLRANPRNGGTKKRIISYLVFPQSGLGPGKLRTAKEINDSAAKVFARWGGLHRLKTCSGMSAGRQ